MKRSSIRFKVQLTFAILMAVAVIWALASYAVSSRITHSMRQMVQASALLRNQTDTDMEHDAIRGDVLGVLAARTEPSLNAPELARSLKERTVNFRELYDATLSYEFSRPVHDTASAVKADVELYLASADQIADAALAGQPVSHEALAQFNAKFEALEGSLAGVSDTIETHVADTRSQAGDAARAGTYVMLGCLLLIAGTILMIWRSFIKQILHPIFEIKGAVEQMTRRDLDIVIPAASRPDELGELGQAIYGMRDWIAEAIAARKHQEEEIVRTIGTALTRLAEGDLSGRIETNLQGAFASLKDDFNQAVYQLSDVLGTVHLSTGKMLNGAEEISRSTDDLARRNEQQANSLKAIADAISDVSGKVAASANAVKAAQSAVTDVNGAVEQGGAVIERAVEAMDKIEQSSRAIDSIISVIDGIAFQTNLLALNAGVEAVRAGEAGKGFNVVASEVRALAQRSADAANEIKKLISNSSSQVETGVQLVRSAGDALQAILQKVGEISTVMQGVTSSATEQAGTLSSIDDSAHNIQGITQQNAAATEEVSAVTRMVVEVTRDVVGQLSSFTIEGGRSSSPRRESLAA
ncbi:MAG: HAMP domain-containing protein [Sphingobium sp.]|nr:HAMP domain-containing protein [Sphingobium sp.]MBP6111585.1 HAMP domain-containing protein [Sphingobium sp.]MBP8670966.1 HAMP domain-containing protein [Sphingobium sp.]MBP9158067.1 HAMP domain-containing protein [Sphingobium sp.]MCC6481019.1 HAMP domain-containing protein [Sphingomonadaceae bacterium]